MGFDFVMPEGFTQAVCWPDGVNPEPIPNQFEFPFEGDTFRFYVARSEDVPVLPFRHLGKLWHRAWHIPTRYAIDGTGRCYMDSGHADCLVPVETNTLLAEAYHEDEKLIRKHTGKKSRYPKWAVHAKANGWTPPGDWDESQFDLEGKYDEGTF